MVWFNCLGLFWVVGMAWFVLFCFVEVVMCCCLCWFGLDWFALGWLVLLLFVLDCVRARFAWCGVVVFCHVLCGVVFWYLH